MAGQVQLAFAKGGSIAVEVVGNGAPAGGRDLGGRGIGDDAAQRVTQTFDETLSSLNSMADSLHAALRASLTPPDAVTVQFGVNFSVTGGLIVASGTGGASLNITMQWNKG